jgi:dihydropyrimidinase
MPDASRYDLIVLGDQVAIGDHVRPAAIAIRGERIAALLDVDDAGRPDLAARTIDARGRVVLPGPIDAHVHHNAFSDNPDDWGSLTRGAALGGVTTVIPYVPRGPGLTLGQSLVQIRDEGERESFVDFAMHARLGGPTEDIFDQLPEAFELGVPSFKMFLAYRKRGIMWDGPPLMRALEIIGRLGGIWCCHAEDGDLIDFLEDQYMAGGRYTADTYLATRPHAAEVAAAFRAIQLADTLGCRLYLVHTSAAEVLPLAAASRRSGKQVIVETCPQYLTLTDETTRRNGGLAKIAPPMRHPKDNAALWHGLAHGDVQVVASDHAPGQPDQKRFPPDRYAEISYGAPGVETIFPLLYSEGVAKGRITLPKLADVISGAPARAFDLTPRKGYIAPGADADLVVIDPSVRWRLDGSALQSNAGYSNWDGWEIQGKPVLSLLRGRILLQDGDLKLGPGAGRHLPRQDRRPAMSS